MNEGFDPTSELQWSGEELLARARSGDAGSLGQLFEQYRSYLTLVAERELNSDLRTKCGASDLVQETYREAFEGFSGFRGTSDAELKTWFLQILSNNLKDYRKQYRRAKRDLSREISTHSTETSIGLIQLLSSRSPTASSLMRRQERDEQLERALSLLKDRHREVIAMRHFENCSFSEISDRMSLSEDAARKLWARAIHSLQRELGSNDG